MRETSPRLADFFKTGSKSAGGDEKRSERPGEEWEKSERGGCVPFCIGAAVFVLWDCAGGGALEASLEIAPARGWTSAREAIVREVP